MNGSYLVLTSVNAAYSKKLDAQELVHCLLDPNAAKAACGPMSSFLAMLSFKLPLPKSTVSRTRSSSPQRRRLPRIRASLIRLRRERAIRWAQLFRIACAMIRQVNSEQSIIDRWTFGGGSAMMVQIGHREAMTSISFCLTHSYFPFSIRRNATSILKFCRATIPAMVRRS